MRSNAGGYGGGVPGRFLGHGVIDLILADYTLPSFDGLSALKLALTARPDVPFIFVSGTLGEEVAIEALKIGATDYVLEDAAVAACAVGCTSGRSGRARGTDPERKRAEEALHRSETYLAEAQKLSRTGSFGWDVAKGELYWSDETFRIFEFDPSSKPTVERVIERAHPEDRAHVAQAVGRAAAQGIGYDYEHRLQMPDGAVKFIRVVTSLSSDGPGGLRFVGAVTDITERRRSDEALRESEERFRTMADTLPEAIWIRALDPERVLYVSPSFERIWGLSLEDVFRNPRLWEAAIHLEDRERIAVAIAEWDLGRGRRISRCGVPDRAAGRHNAMDSRPRRTLPE